MENNSLCQRCFKYHPNNDVQLCQYGFNLRFICKKCIEEIKKGNYVSEWSKWKEHKKVCAIPAKICSRKEFEKIYPYVGEEN